MGKSVGDEINTLAQPSDVNLVKGYVPIYDVITAQERVIGFAAIKASGAAPGMLSITGFGSQVGDKNATVVIRGTLRVSGVELEDVLARNRALAADSALFAPVLVR